MSPSRLFPLPPFSLLLPTSFPAVKCCEYIAEEKENHQTLFLLFFFGFLLFLFLSRLVPRAYISVSLSESCGHKREKRKKTRKKSCSLVSVFILFSLSLFTLSNQPVTSSDLTLKWPENDTRKKYIYKNWKKLNILSRADEHNANKVNAVRQGRRRWERSVAVGDEKSRIY